MPKYVNAFNVFECGRKLWERLDVPYKIACMATAREEYFTNMLDSLLDNNERYGNPLPSKKLQEEVSRVMEEE